MADKTSFSRLLYGIKSGEFMLRCNVICGITNKKHKINSESNCAKKIVPVIYGNNDGEHIHCADILEGRLENNDKFFVTEVVSLLRDNWKEYSEAVRGSVTFIDKSIDTFNDVVDDMKDEIGNDIYKFFKVIGEEPQQGFFGAPMEFEFAKQEEGKEIEFVPGTMYCNILYRILSPLNFLIVACDDGGVLLASTNATPSRADEWKQLCELKATGAETPEEYLHDTKWHARRRLLDYVAAYILLQDNIKSDAKTVLPGGILTRDITRIYRNGYGIPIRIY